jgi:hypothetical protein
MQRVLNCVNCVNCPIKFKVTNPTPYLTEMPLARLTVGCPHCDADNAVQWPEGWKFAVVVAQPQEQDAD